MSSENSISLCYSIPALHLLVSIKQSWTLHIGILLAKMDYGEAKVIWTHKLNKKIVSV